MSTDRSEKRREVLCKVLMIKGGVKAGLSLVVVVGACSIVIGVGVIDSKS